MSNPDESLQRRLPEEMTAKGDRIQTVKDVVRQIADYQLEQLGRSGQDNMIADMTFLAQFLPENIRTAVGPYISGSKVAWDSVLEIIIHRLGQLITGEEILMEQATDGSYDATTPNKAVLSALKEKFEDYRRHYRF
jgi:hypothetical protein